MNKFILKAAGFIMFVMQDLYCRQLVRVEEANIKQRQRLVDNVNAAKAALRASQQKLGNFDNHAAAHSERTADELEFYGHELA